MAKKIYILKYRPDNHLVLCPLYQTSKRKDPENKLGGGGCDPKKKIKGKSRIDARIKDTSGISYLTSEFQMNLHTHISSWYNLGAVMEKLHCNHDLLLLEIYRLKL